MKPKPPFRYCNDCNICVGRRWGDPWKIFLCATCLAKARKEKGKPKAGSGQGDDIGF